MIAHAAGRLQRRPYRWALVCGQFDLSAGSVAGMTSVFTAASYAFMDTVGLHALGLPDAQIAFPDLPEGAVAGLLFDLAGYLLGGADIRPGHTVQGLHHDQRWQVSEAPAALDPQRWLLELEPSTAVGDER
jgi:Domain of unknown function (DUF4261)